MPLFDFKCPACGAVREVLVRGAMPRVMCNHDTVHYVMDRQLAAPSFIVKGFNSVNGYASPRTIHQRHANGIKTTTTGNPEAFTTLF